MKEAHEIHYSVMMSEVLASLNLKPSQTVVDCTVNRAGHASEIAKIIGSGGTLIIFDLDKEALSFSEKKLNELPNHPTIIAIHSDYRYIKDELLKRNIVGVDRIFADLGFSSQEIEVSGRGFSFMKDEPLYMTYQSEVGESTFTAKDLVNTLHAQGLAQIFKSYGDEVRASQVANAIVEARKEKSIETTQDLVKIILSVKKRTGKIHPATKIFQALRIAVNDEYEGIERLVRDGVGLLKEGGIMSILTFHSGEDRVVKNLFKELGDNRKEKPKREEVVKDKRSRSAILRTLTL